jgi:periplasmic protein TonB
MKNGGRMRSHIGWLLVAGLLCASAASSQAQPATGKDASCNLMPIMRTHTAPPYPAESVLAHEEGIVLIEVTIGADGKPTHSRVVTSSGYARLDDATAPWIKDNWLWEPFGKSCAPLRTQISMNWNLRDLMPATSNAKPYDGQAITKLLMDHP